MSGVVALRDELLNREIFATAFEEKILIERCVRDHSTRRLPMPMPPGAGAEPRSLAAPLHGPGNGQGLTQQVDPSSGACQCPAAPTAWRVSL
jgi:hypothetical protein